MSLEAYLINLKQSTDRLMAMQGSLSQIGVNYERVEAIDIKTLPDNILAAVTAPNIEYPHRLRPGEIACFLSHRKCWQKLIDSGKDWALILEDHCQFSPLADRYLNSVNWIPSGCEIVQIHLSDKHFYSNKRIELADGNALLNVISSPARRSSAYFISRHAAQVALNNSKKISCPLDNFILGSGSTFSKEIEIWRLLGSVVRRNTQAKTTIHGRGSTNKVRNKERVHPKRIFKKLSTRLHRIFLKKNYQFWLTE